MDGCAVMKKKISQPALTEIEPRGLGGMDSASLLFRTIINYIIIGRVGPGRVLDDPQNLVLIIHTGGESEGDEDQLGGYRSDL